MDGRDDLNDLGSRVRKAQERRSGKSRSADGKSVDGAQMGAGFRIATEMVAALGVGVILGISLDTWLGTSPWFLIVFFLLGCGAAFRNVYRTAQQLEKERKERRRAAEAQAGSSARPAAEEGPTSRGPAPDRGGSDGN